MSLTYPASPGFNISGNNVNNSGELVNERVNSGVMHSIENAIKTYKVIVVGDSNVGKTTLSYRFCEGNFLNQAEATIGVDFRERILNLDGEEIKLQLWDTAGQERFRRSMVQHYYRNAHAVVFVYDISNPKSFESLKEWVEEVNKNTFSDIPRILVGNKCDLPNGINTNVAIQFADEHYMPHFETSARMDSQADNVEAIFITLAHKLKQQKPMMRHPSIEPKSFSSSNDSSQGCCG